VLASLAFVAADTEDHVVVRDEDVGVGPLYNDSGARFVDPVLPVPDKPQLLRNLHGDVVADGEARAHRRAGKIEAKIAVLHETFRLRCAMLLVSASAMPESGAIAG
jgi:hypothetical protein